MDEPLRITVIELLASNVAAGRLRFTTDHAEAAEFGAVHFLGADHTELGPAGVVALPARPLVLDGRNALDVARWRAAGWTCRGLGRPNA